MLQVILSFLIAFVITWLLGKVVIPWLHLLKAGQSIKEIGPSWHMYKQGTPTMGGIMFIPAILVAMLLCSIPQLSEGRFGGLIVFVAALAFAGIGFVDDYVKIRHHHNDGLTPKQKFALQLVAGVLLVILLWLRGYLSTNLYIPFVGLYLPLPMVLFLPIALFIIVGCDNAVNLTDGVDGLATGVTIPVTLFFTVIAMRWGYTEIGVLSAALLGGLAGFLIYNYHPAKVFMGDTGALFLGGMVAGLAFVLDVPLTLALVGIIYICETLSVMIQVQYYRRTGGKRLFKMTPLHHHFEMCGWSEYKLFYVSSGITLIFCILALLGVMGK